MIGRGLRRRCVAALALTLACAGGLAGAQGSDGEIGAGAVSDGQSLGDIRAELTVLDGQIRELRDALVRGAAEPTGLPEAAATPLTRLDQLEGELRRLNNRVDVLTNDVTRIVDDATNRVADIEFRLTELEGGDVSLLGRGQALGGGVTVTRPLARPGPDGPPAPTAELAVAEQSDFEAAVAAAEAGEHDKAADLFAAFLETYPAGPLSSEAQFRRGDALAAQSEWRAAARSYLDAFSGSPEGPLAPQALLQLAVSLGKIGQTDEACLTLTEVVSRYPGSAAAGEVPAQRQELACS